MLMLLAFVGVLVLLRGEGDNYAGGSSKNSIGTDKSLFL